MQLEISLIISQILAFLIMLWILKKFAWKPLLKTMSERKEKIQSEFTAISEQKKEIEKLMDLYKSKLESIEEEAKQKIAESITYGNNLAQKIREEALDQAKAIFAKAQSDIAGHMLKAKTELKDQIVNTVIQATQKLIAEKLDAEKDRKLIMEFINDYL